MRLTREVLLSRLCQSITCVAIISIFAGAASAAVVVRDAKKNIIAIKSLAVAGLGQYDVNLEYEPRKFNEIWPSFPNPQTPPAFWGNPDGARAARDAVVDVLQAEHGAQQSLLGGGRFSFIVPIGATASGQMTSTLGYYRHYNNWLWSKGRGVDTGAVDVGHKAVYARFKRSIDPATFLKGSNWQWSQPSPAPGSTLKIGLSFGKDNKFSWETQTQNYIPPNSPVAVGPALALFTGTYAVTGNKVALTFDAGGITASGVLGPDPRDQAKHLLLVDLGAATIGFEQ